MFGDIKGIRSLGDFSLIKRLATEQLFSEKYIPYDDLQEYFGEKDIRLLRTFNGIINLLAFCDLISVQGKRLKLKKRPYYLKDFLLSKDQFCDFIVERIFTSLIIKDILIDFLQINSIAFNINLEDIVIKTNLIPLKYSGLRNFLIDIGFFDTTKSPISLFTINPKYKIFFESTLLPEIRKKSLVEVKSNILSLAKFMELQEKLKLFGEEAEDFVFQYELKRLEKHPNLDKVKIISKIDVSAGFDIISYNKISSKKLDRFIEVKSYRERVGFFWSKNEVEVSMSNESNYYLYLVNRAESNESRYSPIIIANPYKNVFEDSSWKKESQKWYMTQNR